MTNMSYCRFENTLEDLRDCYEHIDETLSNKDEHKARIRLYKLCQKVTEAIELEDLEELFDEEVD